MQLPEVKSSDPAISVFTSNPDLIALASILSTLLTIEGIKSEDIKRVFKFAQVAFESGILVGAEHTLSEFEAAMLKKLDKLPPIKVN